MAWLKTRRAGARVYRSASATRGAVFSTVVLVGLVALALVPGRGEVVGYVFAPLWLIWTWRSWQVGVHVETGGVKVVGALASRRIAWEEIDCFDVRPWLRYPYTGYVVLTGARRPIPVMGITTAGGESERHRGQAQEPIDHLNEALAEWRRRNCHGNDPTRL